MRTVVMRKENLVVRGGDGSGGEGRGEARGDVGCFLSTSWSNMGPPGLGKNFEFAEYSPF